MTFLIIQDEERRSEQEGEQTAAHRAAGRRPPDCGFVCRETRRTELAEGIADAEAKKSAAEKAGLDAEFSVTGGVESRRFLTAGPRGSLSLPLFNRSRMAELPQLSASALKIPFLSRLDEARRNVPFRQEALYDSADTYLSEASNYGSSPPGTLASSSSAVWRIKGELESALSTLSAPLGVPIVSGLESPPRLPELFSGASPSSHAR